MRTARITYKDAYHHIVSKGLNGKNIFLDDGDRIYYLNLLEEKATQYSISVFAYTLMRNHYHIVLCNSSGRMSDMMRVLNGGFAVYFRKKHGGSGYLFKDRYFSTLIENEKYAWRVVRYALVNPSVAGLCKNPFNYKWSSINYYFSKSPSFVDTSLVESLFETKADFRKTIGEYRYRELDVRKGKFGAVIGGPKFEGIIEKKFDRRKAQSRSGHAHMRKREEEHMVQKPVKEILRLFVEYFGIEDLNGFLKETSHESTRKADILIKLLKEEGAMSYKDISRELGLKFSSLGHRYKRAKERGVPAGLMGLLSGGK